MNQAAGTCLNVDGGSSALNTNTHQYTCDDTNPAKRFSHDKLREVAHDRLDAVARASLHRAVAGALDARLSVVPAPPGVAERAAHHFLEAGDEGKAGPLLLAAARRSLVACDSERTVASYRRALSILDAPGAAAHHELLARRALWEEAADPGAAAFTDGASALREALRKAHRGLGDALTVLGRYDDALEAYAAAVRHSASDEARADALGRMGTACFAKGELLLGARHLTEALGHLGERLPETRAGVLASIGASALRLAGRIVWRRPLVSERARAVECLRVRLLNRLTYINYSFSLERAVGTNLAALAAAERVAATSDAAETFSHHGALFAGILPVSSRLYARRAVAVCQREGHLAWR